VHRVVPLLAALAFAGSAGAQTLPVAASYYPQFVHGLEAAFSTRAS
jgi:hypothetical protein